MLGIHDHDHDHDYDYDYVPVTCHREHNVTGKHPRKF